MLFAAPLWLLMLLPWAGLVVWLMRRRRVTTPVPFLRFWPGAALRPAVRASLGRPPWPIVLLLLAMAMAIVGAARPAIAILPTPVPAPAPHPPPTVTISAFAASVTPHPQVLIRLKSQRFTGRSVVCTVASAEQIVRRIVPLGVDDTQTIFVDLPRLGSTIMATVGDKSATLRRRGKGIRLAADARVPENLRRLIDLYRRAHPDDETGHKPGDEITLSIDSALPPNRSGIALASIDAASLGPWTVVDDPLTRDVDWSRLTGGCGVDPSWTPLVYHGRSTLIARRADPAPQALVSVATNDWAATGAFVVFWNNALDWLAGGGGRYVAETNSHPAAIVQRDAHPERREEIPETSRDLSPLALLMALAFLLFAAITYTPLYVQPARQAAHPHR